MNTLLVPRSGPALFDVADQIDLAGNAFGSVQRFDSRSDQELLESASTHEDAVERERALWEYAERHRESSLDLLAQRASNDADREVRIGTLWLIQKIAGDRAAEMLTAFLQDDDVEVRDWAGLMMDECLGGYGQIPVDRPIRVDPANPFDQTLPLMIAGYARVRMPDGTSVQATLTPKWFVSIMGRVMACTSDSTFETDLTVEKRIFDYHGDGSDHYEAYAFRGLTYNLADGVAYHAYDGRGHHTFYPSGKVEDTSAAPLHDVTVGLRRQAITGRVWAPEIDRRVVRSVRGRYSGEAFVSLARVMSRSGTVRIDPGEVQLSDLHHPVAGPMTNTLLFGTFKGKLSDLNSDGELDINTERSHAGPNGRLDYKGDGSMENDPYDPISGVGDWR